MQACRLGNDLSQDAFRALYERYEGLVHDVCQRMTNNSSDALDAAQDAFGRVFRYLDRFRAEARFSSWVHAIAVNASLELRRCARRGARLTLDCDCESDGTGPVSEDTHSPWPGSAAARSEQEHTVQRAMEALSEPLREAVVLRYVEGLSYEEVAVALGIPFGTVKSRLSRAHDILARAFAPHLDELLGA